MPTMNRIFIRTRASYPPEDKRHTGRLDSMTEKCDNARVAGVDRSITGQSVAAGSRRDEFHNGAQCGARTHDPEIKSLMLL